MMTIGQLCLCIFCIAALSKEILCTCSNYLHIDHNSNEMLRNRNKITSRPMTVQTETFFAGTSLFERLSALRSQMSEAAAKRKTYRTTLAELQSLTARELADLGIAPSSIEEIAYEAAYGA
jgi:uncharacterized protein YjiS (DUF1127 family)